MMEWRRESTAQPRTCPLGHRWVDTGSGVCPVCFPGHKQRRGDVHLSISAEVPYSEARAFIKVAQRREPVGFPDRPGEWFRILKCDVTAKRHERAQVEARLERLPDPVGSSQ